MQDNSDDHELNTWVFLRLKAGFILSATSNSLGWNMFSALALQMPSQLPDMLLL